jgi:hypothetical protein
VKARAVGAVIILASLLLVARCAPTATFIPIGTPFATATRSPEQILIYMSPNQPDQPYKTVGSIMVTPPADGGASMEAYLTRLRAKAVELGVDGVVNVEVKPRDRSEASGMCLYGMPYYSQSSYTVYDIKGDAFVWADSADANKPHSGVWTPQTPPPAPTLKSGSISGWWVALVMVSAVGLLVWFGMVHHP